MVFGGCEERTLTVVRRVSSIRYNAYMQEIYDKLQNEVNKFLTSRLLSETVFIL